MLKEESKAGVQVFVIIDNEIQSEEYKDFAIIDDVMIINLFDNDKAKSIIEEKKIKEYNSDFATIKFKANKYF